MLQVLQPTATEAALNACVAWQAPPRVQISPDGTARRRASAWPGMAAEVVRFTRPGEMAIRFDAPVHLLVAYHQGVRGGGETHLDGVRSSTLKDVAHKLVFVPAGHCFEDVHDARVPPQITCLYLDSSNFAGPARLDPASDGPCPRLFFDDRLLWETIAKLTMLIETSSPGDDGYLEALGRLLVHELTRTHDRTPAAPVRGGLAAWQQRIVVEHIEKHLSDTPQLAQLAELVRLSPQHFCRAFKQSLGQPPLRYHGLRRVERAKQMLAQTDHPVTEVGLALGYSETSSFTAAFRRATGFTPTGYRRTLA